MNQPIENVNPLLNQPVNDPNIPAANESPAANNQAVPVNRPQPVPSKNPHLWSKAFEDPDHPNVVDCLIGAPIRTYDSSTPVNYFKASTSPDDQLEDPLERQASFSRIHSQKIWLGGSAIDPGFQDIQSSGIGSTVTTSLTIRNVLHMVFHEVKRLTGKEVIRVLDVPCGDMVWMHQFLQARRDVMYVGMDIVPDLIEHHRNKYASFRQWKFVHGDIINTDLDEKFDLIISRHMTSYLTNRDTMIALEKFSNSGSTFLAATTYPKLGENVDLELKNPAVMHQRFRPQNLEMPPFKLSPPLCVHQDSRLQNAYMAVWKLPLTQVTDCGADKGTIRSQQHTFFSCA